MTSGAELTHESPHSISAVLRIRDYRRMWMGLGLASLGEWVGLLAITALANRSAEDLAALLGQDTDPYALQTFAIAGVLFLRVVPALFLGPLAGWIAERFDRKLVLVAGDVVRAALYLSMPLADNLWWILVATLLIECVSVVWGPAKDATIPQLVPPNRLQAANQVNLATTYGSALPGALLFTGVAYASNWTNHLAGSSLNPLHVALFLTSIGYAVSALFLLTLSSVPRGPREGIERRSVVAVVTEGWRFITVTPLARGLVVGILGAFAAGGVVIGLARVFVSDLGGGDTGYGVLFSCVTLGLGLGMAVAPRLAGGLSRRRLFGVALVLDGLLMLPMALMQDLVPVGIFAMLIGFCAGVCWIVGNTLLGLEIPEEMRARTFAFVGSMSRLVLSSVLALAPLLAGLIGRHEFEGPGARTVTYGGAAATVLISGVVLTVVGVAAYRAMDDRKGIPLSEDLRNMFKHGGFYAATGVFVCFEGGEGAGKSTQSRLLADWLEAEGHVVTRTFEPGDTAVGRRLREIVLDPATGDLSNRTEVLLYAADKAEHVDTVVAPALKAGGVVITDRYVDSTLAYQGAGRQVDGRELERIARWATRDLRPHLTVLLDLAPAEGLGRFEERDRIEGQPVEFHQRVRESFLQMASAAPEHYLVLDARQPVDEIAAAIRARVTPLLSQSRRATVDEGRS